MLLIWVTKSDHGDVEEADYVSASGEAMLVSHGLLRSPIDDYTDEPALWDSLLPDSEKYRSHSQKI